MEKITGIYSIKNVSNQEKDYLKLEEIIGERKKMIKIFADGASIDEILELNKDDEISGFTTNPTLMKKAGVTNYEEFAKEVLSLVDITKPVSFEVLADDHRLTKEQALKISSWGKNVYVKIPVTNITGEPNYDLMEELSLKGVMVNATAITTGEQIRRVSWALNTNTPAIISVFAGRIADTGLNPKTFVSYAAQIKKKNQEILWASPREPYNFIEAKEADADIITLTYSVYKKMQTQWFKDLSQVSLEIVQMFYKDGQDSGLTL